MRRRTRSLLDLAALLTLLASLSGGLGCGPAFVSLDNQNVTALDLSLVRQESLCPGEPVQLKILATLDNGKTLETWHHQGKSTIKDGKLDFETFSFSSEHGAFKAKDGTFTPDFNSLRAGRDGYTVTARLRQGGTASAEKTFEANFRCVTRADFSASGGARGITGHGGHNGVAGARGNARDGAAGGNGGAGANGTNGANGQSAGVLEAALGYYVVDGKKLLLVRIRRPADHGQTFTYPFHLDTGERFIIFAHGGPGGSGGDGGDGGNGGDGGDGDPGFNGGAGGAGGAGGLGGNGADGGDGGVITLTVPEEHPELLDYVRVENGGGRGGAAGTGGRGGRGGSGGEPDGTDGTNGPDGSDGQASGRDGAPGPEATLVRRPVREIFAAELEQGYPIE